MCIRDSVEIIGALQKALPADMAAQINETMERFTQARSLSAIVSALNGMVPAAAPGAAPTPSPAPAIAPSTAPSTDRLKSTLLELVADRTGYPQDMLALDADLEADLGVDSIKRVEIIGALQKALPADMAAQINETMERFTLSLIHI